LTFTIMSARAKISFAWRRCGAGRRVLFVRQADLGPGAGLHQHLVAARDQFVDAGRGQADPVFVVFDFLRNAN
jgi:hypothetical protein